MIGNQRAPGRKTRHAQIQWRGKKKAKQPRKGQEKRDIKGRRRKVKRAPNRSLAEEEEGIQRGRGKAEPSRGKKEGVEKTAPKLGGPLTDSFFKGTERWKTPRKMPAEKREEEGIPAPNRLKEKEGEQKRGGGPEKGRPILGSLLDGLGEKGREQGGPLERVEVSARQGGREKWKRDTRVFKKKIKKPSTI